MEADERTGEAGVRAAAGGGTKRRRRQPDLTAPSEIRADMVGEEQRREDL